VPKQGKKGRFEGQKGEARSTQSQVKPGARLRRENKNSEGPTMRWMEEISREGGKGAWLKPEFDGLRIRPDNLGKMKPTSGENLGKLEKILGSLKPGAQRIPEANRRPRIGPTSPIPVLRGPVKGTSQGVSPGLDRSERRYKKKGGEHRRCK